MHEEVLLGIADTYRKEELFSLVTANMICGKININIDINTVFNSYVAFVKDIEILCVILTGIGEDGVDATKELSLNGARSITETAESAIVDGMPCRARKIVPNIEVYHISDIITKIKEFCR